MRYGLGIYFEVQPKVDMKADDDKRKAAYPRARTSASVGQRYCTPLEHIRAVSWLPYERALQLRVADNRGIAIDWVTDKLIRKHGIEDGPFQDIEIRFGNDDLKLRRTTKIFGNNQVTIKEYLRCLSVTSPAGVRSYIRKRVDSL